MSRYLSDIVDLAEHAFQLKADNQIEQFEHFFAEVQRMMKSLRLRDFRLEAGDIASPGGFPVSVVEAFTSPHVTVQAVIVRDGLCVPLHDHPQMHCLKKSLRGSVFVDSYTPLDLQVPAETSSFARPLMPARREPLELITAYNRKVAKVEPVKNNVHSLHPLYGETAVIAEIFGRSSGISYYTVAGEAWHSPTGRTTYMLQCNHHPRYFEIDHLRMRGGKLRAAPIV